MGNDTLAERLRRRPAKPMGSPRVGSNPTGVVLIYGVHCTTAVLWVLHSASTPPLALDGGINPHTITAWQSVVLRALLPGGFGCGLLLSDF